MSVGPTLSLWLGFIGFINKDTITIRGEVVERIIEMG